MKATYTITCAPWIEYGFEYDTLEEAVSHIPEAREKANKSEYGPCKCFDEVASIGMEDENYNTLALYDINGTLIEKY